MTTDQKSSILVLTRRPIAAVISSLLFATLPHPAAWANPTGEHVVSGQASFNRDGSRLTVVNTPGTQINWRDFNIAAGETTQFQQQSASSAVFNRVVGDPSQGMKAQVSQIFGSLSSNGAVYLYNPSGVIFGRNASINVASLVVTTLDFRVGSNGQVNFFKSPDLGSGDYAGKIINQGTITSALGGQVWLVGETVRNEGVIRAEQGKVLLAAGHSVTIGDTAAPELTVTIDASQGQAVNLGTINASGGSIDLFGALLDNQGELNVDTASVDSAGRVRLSSTRSTAVSGTISAQNSAGQGGHIALLSDDTVSLASTARIEASGKTGGGTVLVGGDWQGQNAAVKNAANVVMAQGASIAANALDQGNGGKVVLWSTGTTDFKGTIYAQGGVNGGDGGNVETSGKQHLLKGGYVSTGAYKGKGGLWLIDPAKLCLGDVNTSCAVDADYWSGSDLANLFISYSGTYPGSYTKTTNTDGFVVLSATDIIDVYALNLSGTAFKNQQLALETTGTNSSINIHGAITAPAQSQNVYTTGTSTTVGDIHKSPDGGAWIGSTVQTSYATDYLALRLKSANITFDSTGGITNALTQLSANKINNNPITATIYNTVPDYLTGKINNLPVLTTTETTTLYTQIVDSSAPDTQPVATISTAWSKQTPASTQKQLAQTTNNFSLIPLNVTTTYDTAASTCSQDPNSAACKAAVEAVNEIYKATMANDPALKAAATAACAAGDTAACSFVADVFGTNAAALSVTSAAAAAKGFSSVQVGTSRDQLQQAAQERKAVKTDLLTNSLGILQRHPDAADIPACGGGADACIPDPQQTRMAALARQQQASAPTPKLAFVPQIKRKIALMIAVEKYDNGEIPALEAPVRDADAIGAELTNRLGYEVQTLKNPTKADIVRAMKQIAQTANIDDSVTVYYAGHGYQKDDGAGYWLPADAGVDNPGKWISNRDIAKMLEAIPAKQVMLVADSCYSGSLVGDAAATRAPGLATPGDVANLLNKRAVMVLSSGGEEPVSDEGRNGHSIFAWSLLESLRKVDSIAPVGSQFGQISQRVSASYPQTPKYAVLTAADSEPNVDYLLERRQLR
jgi:filamentous hemagglutinin family protein